MALPGETLGTLPAGQVWGRAYLYSYERGDVVGGGG